MTREQNGKPIPATSTGTLGTFAGVFTPSVLTILGIILFLRLGFVVGSAGLGRTLVILLLANGISVLTSFSLSAISTNIRVKVGGIYYLISRTLGLEFGGAIGIVMFLAQSVSIAFYCIGFGEVLGAIVSAQDTKVFSQIVAAVSVSVLFFLAWLGADWATRFQYVVMAFLGAALVSFFIGLGFVYGRPTHPSGAGRRSHISVFAAVCQGRRQNEQSPKGGCALSMYRSRDDRTGSAQHHCPGGIDVLSRFLRFIKLCDLF